MKRFWQSALAIYFAGIFVVWYFMQALENWMNGGGGGVLNNLKYFVRQLSWYSPGGLRRRSAFIRERVNDPVYQDPRVRRGVIAGRNRSWDYEEVFQLECYEECAKDTLGHPLEFWFGMSLAFLWPVTLVIHGTMEVKEALQRRIWPSE